MATRIVWCVAAGVVPPSGGGLEEVLEGMWRSVA